jgi:putative membrane protein
VDVQAQELGHVSPFWGRYGFLWGIFAAVLLAIPVVAWVVEQHTRFADVLPTLNATLNATSAVLLLFGWRAIRSGKRSLHWKCMVAATATSTLFLVFYLIRFALTGAHSYPLHDFTRPIYLAILSTHTLCAMTIPALVAVSLWRGAHGRYDKHRRIARITLPIWLYVSVTGVIVYLMLYHLARV